MSCKREYINKGCYTQCGEINIPLTSSNKEVVVEFHLGSNIKKITGLIEEDLLIIDVSDLPVLRELLFRIMDTNGVQLQDHPYWFKIILKINN